MVFACKIEKSGMARNTTVFAIGLHSCIILVQCLALDLHQLGVDAVAKGDFEHFDYQDALRKCVVFFQGQRSGKLPANQTIRWRSDSGLFSGCSKHVNLSGGYYDAGDNIKFGLPMAFTVTMLSWSVLEFGNCMPNEIGHTEEAIRWGTDYLLNACSQLPKALYVQVGDPRADHKCWQRAEDICNWPVYKVTPKRPGSDVAGETAAALAAASLVFKTSDPQYSKKLLATAEKAFAFADTYRGNYSVYLKSVVCPYYCSYSGYHDELLWGAAWLLRATHNSSYANVVRSENTDADYSFFSWDSKFPGARVLLSQDYHIENEDTFPEIRKKAEKYICSMLPNTPMTAIKYTPGGLMYFLNGSNLQYVASTSFLLATYAKYLKASGKTIKCGDMIVTSFLLTEEVEKQVDYILGDNPVNMSYMVGFGKRFPQRIHHRGSSLPSLKQHPEAIGCKSGFSAFNSEDPNPHILTGAVVGGPDDDDSYADDRKNYAQSEPTTYINAALVGPLAYLADEGDC